MQELKNFTSKINVKHYIIISSFIIGFLIFYLLIFYFNISTDIQDHVTVLQEDIEKKAFRINFLHYLLVWIISGFSIETKPLLWSSIMVLSTAVSLKAYLTFTWLKKELIVSTKVISFFSISLILVTNIFFQHHFNLWNKILGMISPNVWQNSTVIVLMPFALLLYFELQKFLKDPKTLKISIITILIIMNAIAKPNYLFTIIPSLGIIFIFYKEYWQYLKKFATFIGIIVIVLALQYFLNYVFQVSETNGGEQGIIIKPFHSISIWNGNIPLSLLYSFLFPAFVSIFYFRELIKSREWLFLILNLLIGLTIGYLLCEIGKYEYHMNFMWQNVVNQYLLFCFLIIWLLKKQLNYKSIICFIAFGIHLIFGLSYLYLTFWNGNYF